MQIDLFVFNNLVVSYIHGNGSLSDSGGGRDNFVVRLARPEAGAYNSLLQLPKAIHVSLISADI
jgi:hypothetical protein